MAKPNPLLDHLRDAEYRDERGCLFTNQNRLQFNYLSVHGIWEDVAGIIAEPMCSGVAWFPDANIAFLNATTPVWDALRLSALCSPIGSTVISGVAEYEMKEWLDEPFRNKKRAADIKAAMDGATWIKKFRMVPSHPLNKALYGYTHLLGFRRSLARQLFDGTTLVDTDASDKSRTMNEIRNRFGPRAQGLAKKGRTEDEMHSLMAILYALMNSRPTVILTADADYLEIFYKCQWFFDTHYRAWLAAKMVKAGEFGEPVMYLQETDGHFQGPLTLYRRHSLNLQEVLPLWAQPVMVTLIYVAPDSRMHIMSFAFELPMSEMIEMRSKTDGRCTDIFGDANIHVDLGPLKRNLSGLYLGVGRDVVHPFTTNEVQSSFARLDLQHSVGCFERFSA